MTCAAGKVCVALCSRGDGLSTSGGWFDWQFLQVYFFDLASSMLMAYLVIFVHVVLWYLSWHLSHVIGTSEDLNSLLHSPQVLSGMTSGVWLFGLAFCLGLVRGDRSKGETCSGW